jgi:hypothetical protein
VAHWLCLLTQEHIPIPMYYARSCEVMLVDLTWLVIPVVPPERKDAGSPMPSSPDRGLLSSLSFQSGCLLARTALISGMVMYSSMIC